MIFLTLSIALIAAVVKAENSTYCWSEEVNEGYPCCSENSEVVYTDEYGDWGVNNDEWCGIREGRCWSQAGGYKCCVKNEPVVLIDQDGIWGKKDGYWCGYRESEQKWVDRELIEDTKNEWNAFKSKWDNIYKTDFERLSVFAGDNETALNFGWYSTTNDPEPTICWGQDENKCTEFIGSSEKHYYVNGQQYYSNKVTVTGIERDSEYYYKRKLNGNYEKAIKFSTYHSNEFNFIFVGDPQIGGSHDRYTKSNLYERVLSVEEGTRNDAFNWNRTMVSSFNLAKQPSLLLSAGDQADEENINYYNEKEHYNEEIQYSAFLLPEQMQQIPLAAALGNHDKNTENFRHHFNVPNPFKNPSYLKSDGWIAAYNYFFKYNNVLVVVLESNHEECTDFETVVNNAIEKYPDTNWRIAMFHHDIYGNGVTHSLEENITEGLRPCLTRLFSENKFDLVINGHDHVYTASKFVTYTGDNNDSDSIYDVNEIQQGEVNKDPEGTLYITANCSTGNKLYSYYSTDPDYVFSNVQSYSATFGILDFKNESGKVTLKITSYEVETHDITDGPYIIEKTLPCWAESLGYECCTGTSTSVEYVDDNGKWGYENDKWCGIIENGDSNPTTTITTTTTTKTVPTTTTTTTTTKTIPTTTTTTTTKTVPTTTTTTTTKTVPTTTTTTTTAKTIPRTTTTTTTKTIPTTTTTTTITTTITTTTTTETPKPTNCAASWAQCGGFDYYGGNCCEDANAVCVKFNDFYSQCIPMNS